jgi:hypothetical protein
VIGAGSVDGDDRIAVVFGKLRYLSSTHHGAVAIHQFTQDGVGLQPGHACQVHGTLGMSGASTDAFRVGAEREDVSRAY